MVVNSNKAFVSQATSMLLTSFQNKQYTSETVISLRVAATVSYT
ncbi:hypothetical protein BFJ69_g4016 [Fusarium oxysporum]|uniref:Uncharacterized protein n=1 Tax=Fusarium oxysporum TaxID=5507 RepID=A0A420NKT5_FUSOX|nr:hypothetical protein BFJ69_g4016 [Fusarium oxysporum]